MERDIHAQVRDTVKSAQTKFTSAIMQELHNAAGAKQAGKCMQPVSIIILYDTSETRQ